MIIELHYLQNFAPSNLNRDDTGAPKDCDFGGHRRARISSQCFKRAIRAAFVDYRLLGDDTQSQVATRTKRLVHEVVARLVAQGKPEDAATLAVVFLLSAVKLKVGDDYETQYLLYIPRRTLDTFAGIVAEHWDAVLSAAAPSGAAATATPTDKKKEKSAKKAGAVAALSKEITSAVAELLQHDTKVPDLALFGRMIADSPDWNVDAACQVAHAISTNRVNMEFDFYTAVDDLRPKAEAGAGMMGTIAFQSACFYRYACLDVNALGRNLGDADGTVLRTTVEAFLRASALAIPTGKQNSMAAHNRPSYLLAAVRRAGAPLSLANAFVKPVRAGAEASLVESSVAALEGYLEESSKLWGDRGVEYFACGTQPSRSSHQSRVKRCGSFDDWVSEVGSAGLTS